MEVLFTQLVFGIDWEIKGKSHNQQTILVISETIKQNAGECSTFPKDKTIGKLYKLSSSFDARVRLIAMKLR